jgi:hypothetical protein
MTEPKTQARTFTSLHFTAAIVTMSPDENMPPTTTNTSSEGVVPNTDAKISSEEKKTASVKIAAETVTEVDSIDETETASKKRPAATGETASDETETSEHEHEPTKRSRTGNEEEVLDLALTLGLKPGDRFEVQWEITQDAGDVTGDLTAAADETEPETITRWWGATLLGHDGRTEDSVAVRVLDYDPFPEGGFPEGSPEDVIFMGHDVLIDPNTNQELHYRREGEDDSSAVWLGREGVEEVVNATLSNAMQKNSKSWNGLSRAQQGSIAEIIAQKKEKLVQLLLSQPNKLITTSEMQAIIAQTMQE